VTVIAPDTIHDVGNSQSGKSETAAQSKTSPSREQDTYFLTRISIDRKELRNVPVSFLLRPGMKATADIKVGQRSVIEYILDPLKRALNESMREP